jgi:hypothetical protein
MLYRLCISALFQVCTIKTLQQHQVRWELNGTYQLLASGMVLDYCGVTYAPQRNKPELYRG